MTRPIVRRLLALTVVLGLGGAALAAAPVRPGDAERLASARDALVSALSGPAGADRGAAEAALTRIEALLDSYHHAPNLRREEARGAVLALRPVVGGLLAPGGPLVLHDDVIHPRPAVALALADAARAEGERDAEIRWLRAALATDPDAPATLRALRDACLAVGDVPAANAVSTRLKALVGGAAVTAPK